MGSFRSRRPSVGVLLALGLASLAPPCHSAPSDVAAAPRPVSTAGSTDDVAARLPPNLLVDDDDRDLVLHMWMRSPTFRRQCVRLAGHPNLTVQVERATVARGARAVTRLSREPDGRLHAAVRIGPGRDFVELVAHEIEHVVEWIDGVNHRLAGSAGTSGVVATALGYETTRATRAGRTVADEYRAPGS